MSSFFNRLRNGSNAAPLERPQITRSQSTDSNRFSNGNIRKSYVEDNGSNSDSNMRTSSSTSALAHKFQQHDASNSSNSDRRSSRSRKPLVVHYALSPALATRPSSNSKSDDVTPLTASALAPLDDPIRMTVKPLANSRRFSRAHTADAYDTTGEMDSFDVESTMTGFLSSFSPSSQRASSRNRRHRRPPQSNSAASPASTLSSSGYQSPVASSRPSSTSSAALPERESYRHRSSTRHRLSVSFSNHAQRQAQHKAKKYDVEWRGDHESPCCQVCYAMFTKLSRRRHHCRVCGDLVCGDCSQDQVMLEGRFESPKRACVACVTLLQVMLHRGDPRVSIEGSSSKQVRPDASKDQQQPLATPRYHDRLGEVHRVMAAGKKSERRGSTLSEMYVISSKWLRSWIAFTRTDPGESDGLASSQHVSTPTNQNGSGSGLAPSPPGPIDNLPLLELSKGKLVKRPELIRDDNVGESSDDGEGDYQLISAEVWEVFQRLYGGGPAIRVMSGDNFRDWIVDAYALLTSAAASVRIAPTVENVLMTRHEASNTMMRASFISMEKAALISSGGYESVNVLAQSGGPRGSSRMSMSGSSSTDSLKDLEKSGNDAMADRASRASMNQARVRPNSPKISNSRTSERYGMRASMVQHGSSGVGSSSSDIRSSSANHTNTGANESDAPKAATAASAFAIAMKQARLNAQKAIDARNQTSATISVAICRLCFSDGMRETRALAATTLSSQHDANDSLRRTNLYGVSSKKRLPHVHVAPHDARVRKDLQLLDSHILCENGVDSVQQHRFEVEKELQDRKHRENEGLRPPLDRIQSLQDLTTTVPKDLRLVHQQASNNKKTVLRQREWRVGHANNLHGALFEPTDSMREHITFPPREDQRMAENGSVVVAYSLQPRTAAAVVAELQPYDEDAAREAMERKMCIRKSSNQMGSDADDASILWCPASYSTLHDSSEEMQRAMAPKKKGTEEERHQDQTRESCSGLEAIAAISGERCARCTDTRCVAKKQNVVARAVECYTHVRQRIDRHKNPGLRYALPVEDLSQTRAYRAGLDPVPSTFEVLASSTMTKDAENTAPPCVPSPAASRIRFRPRSAADHVPFRSCSSANLHATTTESNANSCLEPAPGVDKVAGAKRRPASASVCYLGSSTVYCMDARATASSTVTSSRVVTPITAIGDGCDGADFTSVLDKER